MCHMTLLSPLKAIQYLTLISLMCHMTLLSHLKAIQYLTLNPFQQPKSFF
jgi:hypothetical protein